MGTRKTTRYYFETCKFDLITKKTLFARKRITKSQAEEILKKSGREFGSSDEVCVKHVGKRKYENYDQNWYVIRNKSTLGLEEICDEGLEL